MNYLRESGKSIKEDDNSYKFILIDKQTRKASNHFTSHQHHYNQQQINLANASSSNQQSLSNVKDHEIDADRLHKIRKKMFWSKNSNINNKISSNSEFKLDDYETIMSKFKNQTHLPTKDQPNNIQLQDYRSNSVHILNPIGKSESNYKISSTLNKNPFYSKLKKYNLFGVKLEKICGPYSSTNNRLPVQIMNLLEKVACEGSNSLMIFRKSGSAKQKKSYRNKLNANQAIDYNEMNVHVAALLLKEYIRDYPDGIIDYHLFNDCLNTLTISDSQEKFKVCKQILARLPTWNYVCLKHFMCLFNCIARNSVVNKMDSHNIAVCVAPSMFHKVDRPSDVESSFQKIAFVKYLIENTEQLFGDDTFKLLKSAESIINKENTNLQSTGNKNPLEPCDEKVDVNSSNANKDLNEANTRSYDLKLVNSTETLTSNEQVLFDSNDELSNETTKKKSSSSSSTNHANQPTNKREFGKMLNIVTLKGRKSIGPKLKSKTHSLFSSALNSNKIVNKLEHEVLASHLKSNKEVLNINKSDSNISKSKSKKDQNFVTEQSKQFLMSEKTNLESKAKSSYEIANLATTNGKLQREDVKIRETDEKTKQEEGSLVQKLNHHESNAKFEFEEEDLEMDDIDDDYYEQIETEDANYEELDTEFDHLNGNVDDNEVFEIDDLLNEYKMRRKQNLKLKLNGKKKHQFIVNKLKSRSNQSNKHDTKEQETNKLNVKHDLSSNTLSVDSGLSVPTAASNSDPESEKSSKFVNYNDYRHHRDHHSTTNLKKNIATMKNPNDDEQILIHHFLKRQRRTLTLNQPNSIELNANNEKMYMNSSSLDSILIEKDLNELKEDESRSNEYLMKKRNEHSASTSSVSASSQAKTATITTVTTSAVNKKKRSPSKIMKQFSESDAMFYDLTASSLDLNNQSGTEANSDDLSLSSSNNSNNNKRNSIKSVAPLAPHYNANVSKQQDDFSQDINEVKHVLIPYETDTLPLSYQKIANKNACSLNQNQHANENSYYSLQLQKSSSKRVAPKLINEPIENLKKISTLVATATVPASVLANSENHLKSLNPSFRLINNISSSSSSSSTSTSNENKTSASSQSSSTTNTSMMHTNSNRNNHCHNYHLHPHASRRSIVKINLNNNNTMTDLNANDASIYGMGVQTGTGLANEFMYYSPIVSDASARLSTNEERHIVANSNENKTSSLTKIYIPYNGDELSRKKSFNKVIMKKSVTCYNSSSCTDDRSNESSLSTSRSRESSLSSIKTNSSHFSSLERQQVKMRNSAEKKRSKRISRAKSLNQQIRSNNKIVNIIKHDQLATSGNYNHHAHQAKTNQSNSNSHLNHVRSIKRSVSLKNNTFLLNSNINHAKRDEFNTLKSNHVNKKSQLKEQQSVKYVSKIYSSSTPTQKTSSMSENINHKQEQNENENHTRYSKIIINSNSNQQLKATSKLDNIKEFESNSSLSKNNDNINKLNSSTSSISSTASIIANFQQSINNLSHIQLQPHQQHRQSVDATTLQLIRSNMDNNNNQLRKNSELSKSTRLMQDLAAVTWSVPNIRKQFEQQLKQQQQQQQHQQALYSNSSNDESNRVVVSKLGRTKTTSISSSTTTTNGNETDESQHQAYVKTNAVNYYHLQNRGFKDKNGNPTTYI
jgi:hypothetical protein